MNRGIKGKVKAWVYTRVLGDMRRQLWELFAFAGFATPIIVIQQTLWIFLPRIPEEKRGLLKFSDYITNVLLVVTIICLLTHIYKMIENKIFCLGLIVISFTAAISCSLYKEFVAELGEYAISTLPCAVPYFVSLVVVGIAYGHIWKIMMS